MNGVPLEQIQDDCGIKEVGYATDRDRPIVVGIAVTFEKKQLEAAEGDTFHGTLPLMLTKETALWLSQKLALTVQMYDNAVVEIKNVGNSQRLDQGGFKVPGQARPGGRSFT